MTKRFLVGVADYVTATDQELDVLADIADVKLLGAEAEDQLLETAGSMDALLVYHTTKITEKSIAVMTKCRGIVRCGVGYDNVDLRAAGSRGIVVCNVPDYGTEEVADHALMMLLALARRLLPCDQAIRAGTWSMETYAGAPRLRGRTLGIIGCGRIGSALALRAKVLGMRVVFYDPYKPDGLDKALGVERCYRLEELLSQAEFVSLHCPLTVETRHLLNRQTLAQLPRGAYVINTARGPCLDLDSLYEALQTGQVRYAALDVVEREPLDDDRIRNHPRVLLSPHAAYYSVEGFREMRTKGALEGRRLLLGEAVRNPVNLHCLVNPRCVVAKEMVIG
jgi:phosphoglycerate dehydrogenase-like enzyme